MKKALLSFFLAAPALMLAQNVSFADPIFKALLMDPDLSLGFQYNHIMHLDGTYGPIDTNGDGEIQYAEAADIKRLRLYSGGNGATYNVSSVSGVEAFVNLEDFWCENHQYDAIDTSTMPYLKSLHVRWNNIGELDLSANAALEDVVVAHNELTALDVTGLLWLEQLDCQFNQIGSLDLTQNLVLDTLIANDNQLQGSLYFAYDGIGTVGLDNNDLSFLSFKNGSFFISTALSFQNNPNLLYICADNDAEIAHFQQQASFSNPLTQVNSYCSFTPGGGYNTLQGLARIDADGNGCDPGDGGYPNLRYVVSGPGGGTYSGTGNGAYSIPVFTGSYFYWPLLENPEYYTVTPGSSAPYFDTTGNVHASDFCLVPNGVKHDLEMVVMPLDVLRPGFPVQFKVMVRNKGNQVESGTVTVQYDQAVQEYMSSSPEAVSAPGQLSWTFENLGVTQSVDFYYTLLLNSPMDEPALVGGEVLQFSGNVAGSAPDFTDLTPDDNGFLLSDKTRNSFDPNDKTCLEGETVGIDMIGKYVHYLIRFENTGTADAVNVVVKDILDGSRFETNSLVPLSASHDYVMRQDGNKVEFIFENIQLPFPPSELRHGHIMFKVKLKDNLTAGQQFSNEAGIYFDFNWPIATEPAVTTISALGTDAFTSSGSIIMSPNPATNRVTFEGNLPAHWLIDITDLSGKRITQYRDSRSVNIGNLQPGLYVVVLSDQHTGQKLAVKKLVKK